MKKRIIAICTVVALIALVATATLAYMTDTDTATNTFTIGKVDITLDEPNWDPDNNKLIPGTYLDKDPTVTVESGSEDAYVFVSVEINEFDSFLAIAANELGVSVDDLVDGLADESLIPDFLDIFFKTIDSSDWTLMNPEAFDSVDDSTAQVTLTFGYNSTCAAGDAVTLFSQVGFPASAPSDVLDGLYGTGSTAETFDMVITASAIQAEGLADLDAAYAEL